jgi:hypothetical protein
VENKWNNKGECKMSKYTAAFKYLGIGEGNIKREIIYCKAHGLETGDAQKDLAEIESCLELLTKLESGDYVLKYKDDCNEGDSRFFPIG